jgi:glutathione S-transferase
VEREGGKMQFPYLKDPNTGTALYESDAISRYLFSRYGKGSVPFLYRGTAAALPGGLAGLLLRGGTGHRYMPSRKPEKMLELYSFEASPYCRIVREVLGSLEIPYILHNVAKGSPRRSAFAERSGRMMVPWLVDPNTDTTLFESADIKAYLLETYAS